MFDIGWGELVVIGIVALIAIGPKELPTVLRTLGQWMGKVKRMAAEFQGQFQEALREAELHDLKKQAEDLHSSVTSAADFTNYDPLADADKAADRAAEGAGEPASAEADAAAPTPAVEAAEPLPPIEVPPPPPEPPAPVSHEDLASVEPPPKQAGGKA
jgi:sec-independent protein translocase protein TatB